MGFRVLAFRAELNRVYEPRRSMCTSITQVGPISHNKDGLSGPSSRIVVYMYVCTLWGTRPGFIMYDKAWEIGGSGCRILELIGIDIRLFFG